MLHGFSGSPGTGKSLNAIKYIIENDSWAERPVYYHHIRVLLLDFDVCNSFQGWLYGIYHPANRHNKALHKKLLKIEDEGRLATLEDFPYLAYEFKKHNPVEQWLFWFKKVASPRRLEIYNEALNVLSITEDDLTGDLIKSLGLSWTQFFDPTLIHELPSGSVILADEVQNIWPVRASSKVPTPDIEFVTEHRHAGIDLVYVSQDFRDVDQLIRRRIAHYTHFEFLGGEWLCRYHSNNLFDPASKADLARVGHEKVKRDSTYYGIYLSAIDHTHKVGLSASMRKSLKLAAFAICILIFGVVALFQTPLFAALLDSEPEPQSQPQQSQPQTTIAQIDNTQFIPAVNSVQSYITKYIPRHDAVPWSAPVFDAVTNEPKTYPSLTCVQTVKRCTCFTQQMTSYDIEEQYCQTIAKHGFFDPFKEDSEQRQLKRSNQSRNANVSQQAKGILQ
ncbi:zonular occludens toxin domain-containing protein [Vibrio vulnificus]|uniref:zonular occludens toxin domain-containing protein n=1 Tax=Vibrio vulnificus TaxID=672 RepID=UPI0032EDFE29